MKTVGASGLGGLWAWHIRVTCAAYKITKSESEIFDSFRDIRVYIFNFLRFVCGLWALKWAWQLFLGQSIGIDEKRKCQLKILLF